MYRNVSMFNTSPKISYDFQSILDYFESMGILCLPNKSLLAARKICDWLPDNNLSAETKCQKGVTKCVASCHFASYRKSASFV